MRFGDPPAIALAVLLSLGCGSASGADIYVIAGPDVKLSVEDVRELYLGDKEFSGEVRLVPVDNQAALSEFVVKALGMNPQRYNILWVKKAFRDARQGDQRDREILARAGSSRSLPSCSKSGHSSPRSLCSSRSSSPRSRWFSCIRL